MVTIKAVAKGAIAGVHEARGNLARAAGTIVKAAITQAHAVGAEAGSAARSALEGITEGVTEAGGNAGVIARAALRSSLATARDVGALAFEAVRQIVVGSAEGLAEVAESHLAAAKRSTPRPGRARAA
jgi:hypothetical protein